MPALPALRWGADTALSTLFRPEVLVPWLGAGFGLWALSAAAVALQGGNVRRFTQGFALVFPLAWCSLVLAGNTASIAWGIEYVIFALALGLLVSHLGGTFTFIRGRFLGALHQDRAGAHGGHDPVLRCGAGRCPRPRAGARCRGRRLVRLFLAGVTFSRGRGARGDAVDRGIDLRRFGGDRGVRRHSGRPAQAELCHVARADRGRSHDHPHALDRALTGIPDVVAGAWMGGTLDTTGSVTAAGALVSDTTMKVGTIVKFSQNVLIGVAALALSMWWSVRTNANRDQSPGAGVIWQRFPKFVLGFVAASLLFSFVFTPELVKQTSGALGSLRTLWFALAFVSIGLEARVSTC